MPDKCFIGNNVYVYIHCIWLELLANEGSTYNLGSFANGTLFFEILVGKLFQIATKLEDVLQKYLKEPEDDIGSHIPDQHNLG